MTRASAAVERYRHLTVAALVTAGLAVAPARPSLGLTVAGSALIAVAVAGLGVRPSVAAWGGGALLLGVVVGTARVDAIDGAAERVQPGERVEGEATLLERPRPSRFGSSAVLRLANGARVLARAGGRTRWPGAGEPGTIVGLSGSARASRRSAGSDFDWPAYLRRRGIAVEVAVGTLRETGRRRGGPLGAVDAMRRRAEEAIGTGLPPPKAALARGMVLGQDEAIEEPVRDEFRASGLAHLLAVSGQNVMLLAALALPVLAAARAGPVTRAVTVLALIAVYVPLAGAGPSLQRAGVMGAAAAVALAAGRVSSRWYALLLAAAITLTLNPRAVADPGWQLSFAAVTGILLLAPPLRAALRRGVPGVLADGVAMTIAATLATAPLMAHHFGSVSVAGLVANIVALPVVAPVMWLGMAGAAVGQLPALAPALATPAGALVDGLAAADGVLLGYLGWIARLFAEAPGSTVAVPLESPVAVVVAYASITAGSIAIRRVVQRSEPRVTPAIAAWERAPARSRAAAVSAALAAAGLALVAWTGTPAAPQALTVSFLDVGQGDATLIQSADGAAVLFDGGPPEGRVSAQLKRAGVRRLSLVLMTHQSRDHHAGLQEVVERFPVDTLVENGDGTSDGSFWRVVETARRRGARVVKGGGTQELAAGSLRVRVLGPPPRPPGPAPEDPNKRALVTIVSSGAFDLFLSGDAESDALAGYALPDVEAMKVSHHGSADPGLPALLGRLRPQVAVIEVGDDNTYGHPTPQTLAALRAAVPSVHRTDRDGTVRLRIEGARMAVATEH